VTLYDQKEERNSGAEEMRNKNPNKTLANPKTLVTE
jgi:hypothetical protein